MVDKMKGNTGVLRIVTLVLDIVIVALGAGYNGGGAWGGFLFAMAVICFLISLVELILFCLDILTWDEIITKVDKFYHIIAGILMIVAAALYLLLILVNNIYEWCTGEFYRGSGLCGYFVVALIVSIIGIVNGCLLVLIGQKSK